jgi:hypothetical protein
MFRSTQNGWLKKPGARRVLKTAAKCLSAVLLTATSVTGAKDWNPSTSGPTEALHAEWHSVHRGLPLAEYGEISRQNRRIVRGAIQDTAAALGAPQAATAVVGALVALAVDDPRIGLNDSKTLTLQLKDATSRERGLFINVEFAW